MKGISMKKIYKRILIMALPIAFENMIFSLINFVDIFMIGKIGTSAISALGIANQVFFIFTCSVYGLLSGANVLAAQYYGVKNYKNLRKIMTLTIGLGLLMSLPFFILINHSPENVITFYTKDSMVIEYAKQYLKYSIYTFPLFSIGFSFAMQLRAINKPKYSLYSSMSALVINVVLNMILIPRYGVQGAAIATLIARIVTTIYLYIILIIKRIPILPKVREFKDIDIEFTKKLLAISVLTFVHELLWVIADAMKVMMFGSLGTEAFSGIQIVIGINGLLFTLFIGLSNASSIIIGNEIGKSDIEKVYRYANDCLKLYTIFTVIVVIALNIFSPIVLRFMNLDSNMYSITRKLVYSQSISMVFYSYSMLYLSGILRAGGDVMFCMVVELLIMWIVGIPLTYISINVFHLSVYYVYIVARIDDLIKLYPCIRRYVSKEWIKRKI